MEQDLSFIHRRDARSDSTEVQMLKRLASALEGFSINVPMPTIFAPAASARRTSPRIVARKREVINDQDFFFTVRYSGETINSTCGLWYCEALA